MVSAVFWGLNSYSPLILVLLLMVLLIMVLIIAVLIIVILMFVVLKIVFLSHLHASNCNDRRYKNQGKNGTLQKSKSLGVQI